jgi:SAM-dependent methyltransferase
MTTLTPAEANRLFYAEHAVDYDATEFCANAELGKQRLREAMAPALALLPPEARVLDAGGGSGNASHYLFEQGLQPVLVDVSDEMIELWRRKAAGLGFEPQTQVAELEEFFSEDEREWDLVVFSSVLHHLEDPQRLLVQAARRLAPGGLVVTVFDPLRLPRRGAVVRKLDYVGWLFVHARGELPRVVAQRLRPKAPAAPAPNIGAIAEFHAVTGLDDRALISALEGTGLTVVAHRRTHDARFAIFRGLARAMRMPTSFSMVMRAPLAGPGTEAKPR